MIPLVLAALLQGAPSHTALHPREADLFLEIPDRKALLEAYESAPLVRLLRTPEIARWLQKTPLAAELDPAAATDEILDRALANLGLEGALDGVRTISFSARLPSRSSAERDASSGGFLFVLEAESAQLAAALAARVRARSKSEAEIPVGRFDGAVALSLGDIRIPVWLALDAARVFIGGGAGSSDALGAHAASSLATRPILERALEVFDEPRGTTVLWMVQREHPLRTLVTIDESFALFGGKLAQLRSDLDWLVALASPFDPLDGERVIRIQLANSKFRTELFELATGDTSGVLRADSIRAAPVGAMLLGAVHLTDSQREKVGRRALDALAAARELDRAEFDQIRRSIDDLMQRFGSGAFAYAFPLAGLSVPRSYLWLDLEREDRFIDDLIALCERIGKSVPGVEARTREYVVRNKDTRDLRRFAVTTVAIPDVLFSLGPWFRISPAFAIVDGRLLLSPRSSDLKRELKRLFGGGDEPATSALTAEAAALAMGASAVLVLDWRPQVREVIELTKMIAKLWDGIPFDIEGLPSARVFAQHIAPTSFVSKPVEGGIYGRHESSFGPETWLAILATSYRMLSTSSAPDETAPPRDEG